MKILPFWLLLVLMACDGGGGPADAGSDGETSVDSAPDGESDEDSSDDIFALPSPEAMLDPEVYDCRAEDMPPERTSDLPLGCFADPSCPNLVVVAHRASSFFAPENTLSAVRAMIALGVDMVEIDTQVTADGEVVLMHDGEVDRTTDGEGDVEDLTLAEIRSLSLVIHDRLPTDADFECEVVPTFRELLDLCRGRIDIMVDLKGGAAAAAQVVDEEGMLEQAIFLGSGSELEAVRRVFPEALLMVRPHETD